MNLTLLNDVQESRVLGLTDCDDCDCDDCGECDCDDCDCYYNRDNDVYW